VETLNAELGRILSNSLISSVKTISSGTQVDSLLAKFLDLTRPAGTQREVRHNTARIVVGFA
jgi:hypothetical protein